MENNQHKSNKQKRQRKPIVTQAPVAEYQPSKNESSYSNLPPPPQWNYRIISFKNDYIKLQEEITKMLNNGWQLVGGVSTSIYADQYTAHTVFSQAVFKTK